MKYYLGFDKLLPNKYKGFKIFSDEKLQNELNDIKQKYCTENWESVINEINDANMHYKRKSMISQNAYSLSKRLKEEFDIEVFPVIIQHYLGSMHNDTAFWRWHMYTESQSLVGSSQNVKDFCTKRNKIFADIAIGSISNIELTVNYYKLKSV